MPDPNGRRTLSNIVASRLLPGRFLARQLGKPSGRFGRWVMPRGLNNGNADLIEGTLPAIALRDQDRLLDAGFVKLHTTDLRSEVTEGDHVTPAHSPGGG